MNLWWIQITIVLWFPRTFNFNVISYKYIMIHLWECIADAKLLMDLFHMTFISKIWLSIWGTGSGAALPVSNLSLLIPMVPHKLGTTAAQALFNDVFLQYRFSAVLHSDQGGEWLNVVSHQLTKLLSIEHIVTTSYRPHLNGSTERVHRKKASLC